MLIRKKIETKWDKEGKPTNFRTVYYKTYSAEGARPILGSKALAADIPPELAATVCRQLNQLHGGGFEVVAPGLKETA